MDNIQKARRALAAVDVSGHVARIATASAEQQRLAEAIEDGRSQLGEVGQRIREAKEGVATDPVIAGDALLAREAPPSVDVAALYARKGAIEAGMNDLRRREEGLGEIQRRDRSEAIGHLATAVDPLAADVREMALRGAELIVSAFAAAEAVRMATSNGNAANLSASLRKVALLLIDLGYHPNAALPIPDEISDALKAGADSINALRLSIPREIPPPR